MTFTNKQVDALKKVVEDALATDIFYEPRYWAEIIVSGWNLNTMVDYLDLDNRDADSAAEILEELGFDPREEDGLDTAWPEEDPDWPLAYWRYEVANDDTRLGYAGWVEQNKKADSYDKE